ncbi:Fic family protein [Treponema primitia]|uniref:Fic family protein n=1 Tax=Treponema primitia TaxID=88058 RepID=UPI0002554FF8|nr:Fic family protein [Treponema primitia]
MPGNILEVMACPRGCAAALHNQETSDIVKYMKSDVIASNQDLLKSIEGKKRELDALRPFPPEIVRKLNEQFILEWTYNSNAIEGNTLSLQETELVINRGLTIGNKTLKEHFEAINHKDGIEYLYALIKKKKILDESAILEIHKLILKNINDVEAGTYRKTNVMILGAVHLPPSAVKLPRLMQEFMEWYYSNKAKLSVIELAAWVHYKLVYIHPFIDGNGRTARLLMNLILITHGYPPAVILNVDRKKYYRVLKEADREKYGNYFDFIGRSVERSLMIYLNALKSKNDAEDAYGYINMNGASKLCDYSLEYLSYLARTGRLSAIKIGRNWFTTREALLDYIAKVKKK